MLFSTEDAKACRERVTVTPDPDPDPAVELCEIAARVRTLTPSWQRPKLFHEAKSEISAWLARLVRVQNGHALVTSRPAPRVLVRERVRIVERIIVLPRHLVRPGRRPRALPAQGRLALDP